ncbi:hypothetical protein [Hymenobacter qilianensis]|uniref:Uncharacterized protein n=2 Tax=Hymenobacter qilianensis TaxID=1385715 RepID=A0A7H0GTS4_9BACT|nr:hypothetical protein [Hymenobacter qilianensis]QNP51690.1 hypothetical protein H9L05_17205 [Hymenobacter qilianensis]
MRTLQMADTPLLASKKCPHCQQWSAWQHNPTDRCEHCGELLDPRAHQSAIQRNELENQKTSSLILMEIKPEDKGLARFFKTIVRGGQLAFAAILSFIIWVVTVVAG